MKTSDVLYTNKLRLSTKALGPHCPDFYEDIIYQIYILKVNNSVFISHAVFCRDLQAGCGLNIRSTCVHIVAYLFKRDSSYANSSRAVKEWWYQVPELALGRTAYRNLVRRPLSRGGESDDPMQQWKQIVQQWKKMIRKWQEPRDSWTMWYEFGV